MRSTPPVVLLLSALLACAGCGDPTRMFLRPASEFIATPEAMGAAFEDLRLPREDGGETRAWWIPLPEALGTVVIFGGNSGNRSHHLVYARIAREAGFSVLLVEYHGYGPDNGEPEVKDLALDAKAAVRWAGKRPGRVGVWGISLGSAVAIGAAAACPDDVDAICVESSYQLLPAMRNYMGYAMPDVIAAPLSLLVRVFLIRSGADPEPNLERRRAGVPVFFMQGDRDRVTKTLWAARMFERAPGPKALWLMEDTGHSPEPLRSAQPEYEEQIGRFFRSALAGEPDPQACATWRAARTDGIWEIEASVVCDGPFPAPVEVAAVAEDEVVRRRLWVEGRVTRVMLATKRRPATVCARRYYRVALAGRGWTMDASPLTRSYREFNRLSASRQQGHFEPRLLTAEVHPLLGAQYAVEMLENAALAPDPETARAQCLRALEVAPPAAEVPWIVGDARYERATSGTREHVAGECRRIFGNRGWDIAPLEAKIRELEAR